MSSRAEQGLGSSQDDAHAQAIEIMFSIVARAYRYLFSSAASLGHWHEARSTALAGMCIQCLPDEENSNWLHFIRQHIEHSQHRDGTGAGSWGEEIWDTAMSLLCLKSLGAAARDDSVVAGLQWIGSLYSLNGRSNWHDEPWETSWALLAILSYGSAPRDDRYARGQARRFRAFVGTLRRLSQGTRPPVQVAKPAEISIEKTIDWLSSLQDEHGKIVAPHYSAYFVRIAHDAARVLSPDTRQRAKFKSARAAEYLVRDLQESAPERLWTGEAWSNGQILWSLAFTRHFPVQDLTLVRKTVAWFDRHQEPGGNWMDVEDTASAILGLNALLERLLETPEVSGRKALQAELRRIHVPRLYAKLPLYEFQLGYLSIHLNRRTLAILSILGVVATIAVTGRELFDMVLSGFDFLWSHLP